MAASMQYVYSGRTDVVPISTLVSVVIQWQDGVVPLGRIVEKAILKDPGFGGILRNRRGRLRRE